MEKTGVKRFISFSDNEPAMLALMDAAARSVPLVEAIHESCPVEDHAPNGWIEVTVRELKRQMRAVRLSLEKKLFIMPACDGPVLAWVPSFEGDVIAR